MGLQELMMFRDNLQQPAPTGMDNLRNLQALTMQGMAAEDYINEPMMNTGLMSLPVAQAGFGGFIKSIAKAVTRPVKAVAKGVSGLAKGVAGAVKNIASSPIGQFAIPAAAMFFAPQLGVTSLLGKSALAGGASGLTSLAAGEKPEDAFKRAALSAALTYGGGKLFGAGGSGASKGTTGGNITGFTGDPTGATYGAVGAEQTAGLGLSGADIGTAFGDPTVLAGDPSFVTSSYNIPTEGVNVLSDTASQTALETAQATPTIGQRIANFGGTALDKTQAALKAGVEFAKDKPLPTALLGAATLSGLGGGQEIQAMSQYTPRQLSDKDVGFDQQRAFYFDTVTKKPLTLREALSRMQTAAQDFGKGGERKKSGVSLGFEDVDDKVLSASGGLIGMMYGGQTMPENNMDVKYKEFSGMVGGRGSGMEDNVYMPIVEGETGQQVATLAVSPKEYVVDANTMSLLGNGNPDEGAEIMDKTVKDIRKKATGQTKQQKEIDGLAALNRMRRSIS